MRVARECANHSLRNLPMRLEHPNHANDATELGYFGRSKVSVDCQ